MNADRDIQLPLVLYPSRTKAILMLLVSVAFVAGGLWMVSRGQWVGYLSVGFFGLGIVAFTAQIVTRRPNVELREDSFIMHAFFNDASVKWEEVSEFAVIHIPPSMTAMVGWNYLPDYPKTRKVRAFSKLIAGREAGLPDVSMKPAELAPLMNRLRERYLEKHSAMVQR